MTPLAPSPDRELSQLAHAKMARVLGEDRTRLLMAEITTRLGVEIETADDLLAFANELSKLGGFEGAVGAMLSVQAVMRGARLKVRQAG